MGQLGRGRNQCVRELRKLANTCPGLEFDGVVHELLSEHCVGESISQCGGLFNSLAVLAGHGTARDEDRWRAQHILAQAILQADIGHLPNEAKVAVGTINEPTLELLDALHTRLSEDDGIIDDQFTDLLIVAAAAASRALSIPLVDKARASVAAAISRLVESDLEVVTSAEATTWGRISAEADSSAATHWDSLHTYDRSAYVGHVASMRPEALRWELRSGRYSALEARARVAFAGEHLKRHPEFHAPSAEQHAQRVKTALRAMGNLATAAGDRGTLRVSEWIHHRDESVSKAAADALRSFESVEAESHLLALVHSHLEARQALQHARQHKPALQALETLLTWGSVGSDTMASAMVLLMRLPRRVVLGAATVAEPSSLNRCVRSCARERNPKVKRKDHHKDCQEVCEGEARLAGLLTALLRKGLKTNNDHDWLELVWSHAAESHPSWHSHINWQPRDVPLNMSASVMGSRRWASIRRDTGQRILERRQLRPIGRQPLSSSSPPSLIGNLSLSTPRLGHRQLSFWDNIDFDDYSLTFRKWL